MDSSTSSPSKVQSKLRAPRFSARSGMFTGRLSTGGFDREDRRFSVGVSNTSTTSDSIKPNSTYITPEKINHIHETFSPIRPPMSFSENSQSKLRPPTDGRLSVGSKTSIGSISSVHSNISYRSPIANTGIPSFGYKPSSRRVTIAVVQPSEDEENNLNISETIEEESTAQPLVSTNSLPQTTKENPPISANEAILSRVSVPKQNSRESEAGSVIPLDQSELGDERERIRLSEFYGTAHINPESVDSTLSSSKEKGKGKDRDFLLVFNGNQFPESDHSLSVLDEDQIEIDNMKKIEEDNEDNEDDEEEDNNNNNRDSIHKDSSMQDTIIRDPVIRTIHFDDQVDPLVSGPGNIDNFKPDLIDNHDYLSNNMIHDIIRNNIRNSIQNSKNINNNNNNANILSPMSSPSNMDIEKETPITPVTTTSSSTPIQTPTNNNILHAIPSSIPSTSNIDNKSLNTPSSTPPSTGNSIPRPRASLPASHMSHGTYGIRHFGLSTGDGGQPLPRLSVSSTASSSIPHPRGTVGRSFGFHPLPINKDTHKDKEELSMNEISISTNSSILSHDSIQHTPSSTPIKLTLQTSSTTNPVNPANASHHPANGLSSSTNTSLHVPIYRRTVNVVSPIKERSNKRIKSGSSDEEEQNAIKKIRPNQNNNMEGTAILDAGKDIEIPSTSDRNSYPVSDPSINRADISANTIDMKPSVSPIHGDNSRLTPEVNELLHRGHTPVEDPRTYICKPKIQDIVERTLNIVEEVTRAACDKPRGPLSDMKGRNLEFSSILEAQKEIAKKFIHGKSICITDSAAIESELLNVIKCLDKDIYSETSDLNKYLTQFESSKVESQTIGQVINGLKKEKEELEVFNTDYANQKSDYESHISILTSDIETIKHSTQEYILKIEQNMKDIDSLSSKIDVQSKSNKELSQQTITEANKKEDTLCDSLDHFKEENELIQRGIKETEESVKQRIDAYTEDIDKCQQYIEDHQSQVEKDKKEYIETSDDLDRSMRYHTQLENDKNQLNNRLQTALDGYNKLVQSLQSQNVYNQSIQEEMKGEIRTIQENEARAKSDYDNVSKQEEETYSKYLSKHNVLLQYQTSLESLNTDYSQKKKELQELISVYNDTKQQFNNIYNLYTKTNDEKMILEDKVNLQNQLFYTERDSITCQYNVSKSDYDVAREDYLTTMDDYKKQISEYEKENETLSSEVAVLEQEVEGMKNKEEGKNRKYIDEINAYKEKIYSLKNHLSGIDKMQEVIKSSQSVIGDLEKKAYSSENERRELHNILQELRGNIRVIARVRPLLGDEHEDKNYGSIQCTNDTELTIYMPKMNYHYTFDAVFGPDSTQSDIFTEVSTYIQSALDGYNICLFTYGQTGSGKTFTMQGLDTEEERGIIPRAIDKILDEIQKLCVSGWKYDIEVSYVEIYQEKLNDLLNNNGNNEKLDIYLDKNDHPYVPALTRLAVNSKEQISSIMSIASKYRKIGATAMNDTSSRSHVIFTLYLHGTNIMKKTEVEGKLNLVDLAGSERVSRSNVEGERLEETKMINKSLSTLSSVFNNINSKVGHINFRDSKLTFFLKDCLSGDGKTLMFVNLNPSQDSISESNCSLRFASDANQCKLGKAKRTIVRKQ
ncbi:hypothetical protein WA158_007417 [Blastocystis sp. Blastoise]